MPEAGKIKIVLETLNAHTLAVIYGSFKPSEALWSLSHIRFHYNPKHGGWLNMVESEPLVISRQRLNRRIPTFEQLSKAVDSKNEKRNQKSATVNRLFIVADAHTKLFGLYPLHSLS